MNPLWLIQAGGPVVGVIILLSIYGAYVFLTRLQKVTRAAAGQEKLLEWVGGGVLSGNLLEASANAASSDTPLGRVLASGVRTMPQGPKAVQAALDSSITREETDVASGLSSLATIAQVSPLLGLLGTVLGLIRSFGAVASAGGQPTLTDVAGGISLALTSTATGLVV
ncbi:MAG TPA: MotA/TolQ/ExbB proton channel family protein, partial [Deinococcales bacterium]|nr:MotA/TolQ/ExbB proton channel family protein [Deinococcales bacterium]